MKIMKKICVLLIALTMLFALASCGQESSSENFNPEPAPVAEENIATVTVGCDVPLNIVRGTESSLKEAGLWGDDYVLPIYDFTAVDFSTAGEYLASVRTHTLDNTHSWGWGFTVRVVEP